MHVYRLLAPARAISARLAQELTAVRCLVNRKRGRGDSEFRLPFQEGEKGYNPREVQSHDRPVEDRSDLRTFQRKKALEQGSLDKKQWWWVIEQSQRRQAEPRVREVGEAERQERDSA